MTDSSSPNSPEAGAVGSDPLDMTADVDTTARRTSVSATIDATPQEIFRIVADASLHPVIDGSGTVKGSRDAEPQPLRLGSRFSMRMRIGVPYVIASTVVEFEQDRLIAWQHVGRHRWRYELEPTDSGTRVTETFDWSTSLAPKLIELAGYPRRHVAGMQATLRLLADFVTNRSTPL